MTQAAVQRIRREHWGARLSQEKLSDGELHDVGLQSFVDELSFALSSKSPIAMPGPLQLLAPKNGPAIQIFQTGPGGGTIEFINNVFNNTTNNVNNITDIVNNTVNNTTNNVTNVENITIIGPPPPGGNGGFTGSVQVLSGVSFSISSSQSGCTVTTTITPTFTYTTLNFQGGVFTGGG